MEHHVGRLRPLAILRSAQPLDLGSLLERARTPDHLVSGFGGCDAST